MQGWERATARRQARRGDAQAQDAHPACPLPRRDGLVLLISPQWVAQGNVVSDLGFLPWARKANEDFLASFDEVGGRRGGGYAW